ncbi:MAG: hypothetical protein R3324_16350, partial [Halobacteriales archaeon]|nr:hypothetical protein [Halobacteriales archaeon]
MRFDDLGQYPPLALPGYQRWSGPRIELDGDGTGRAWVRVSDHDVTAHLDGPATYGVLKLGTETIFEDRRFAVELVEVSGEVTRNGRRLPNSDFSGERGTVTFERRDDGAFVTVPIGATGPGNFRAALPAGRWAVRVAGNYWSKILPIVPVVPERTVVVGNSPVSDVEIDVAAFRLVGSITANGERLPDEDPGDGVRANLEISRDGEPIWHTVPLAPQGPAGFDVVLGPGTYELGVSHWWFGLGEDTPPETFLPFGEWTAGTVEVSRALRRDIDLRLYEVDVSIRGSEVAGGGRLWFEHRGIERLARLVEFPEGETVAVSTRLYPGHYRVVYEPPAGPSVVLSNSMVVANDMQNAFDLTFPKVSGHVTRNGVSLNVAEPDAELVFQRIPTAPGSVR